jgi:hypothetical protein
MISIRSNYDLHYFNKFKLKDVLSRVGRVRANQKFITHWVFMSGQIKISCIDVIAVMPKTAQVGNKNGR